MLIYLIIVIYCVRRTSNVALEIHTRERLKSLGHKGQTYDEIISELLTQCELDRNMEKSNLAPSSPTNGQTASSTVLVEGGPL